MQSIGYENRNFLVSMGTIALIMGILLMRLFFAFFFKFYLFVTKGKFGGLNFYKLLVKNLFFNIFLQLGFEVFIEITVKAYINI